MVMMRGFSPTDLRAVTKIQLISSSLMKWENELSQIRWGRHRLCSSCDAVSCGPASFPVHMKSTTTAIFTSTQSNDHKQLVARLIGRLFSLWLSVHPDFCHHCPLTASLRKHWGLNYEATSHTRGGVYCVRPITDMDSLTDSRASYVTMMIKLFYN